MADFTFRISPNIVLGSYATSRLGQFALSYGSKFMIIVDPILRECGTAQKITNALDERKIDYFLFDQLSETADSEILNRALNLSRESHIQGIIAVGGGKTIALGRGISSLFRETDLVYNFLDGTPVTAEPLPLICVPTTIRDSFLFTNSIPIVDARNSSIKTLNIPQNGVKLAVFDPNLTSTLTQNQTESMAIETLGIAIESYLSQKSTFFSDMMAEKAVEILGIATDGSDTLTIATPQNELLSQGGCMASLSSSCSSLGIASVLAIAINARYKISRSLTTAILMPYVIENVAQFKADKIAKIAKKLRVIQDDVSDEQAANILAENFRQRLAKANLPARLKELSITIEQLALAVEDAGQLDLMNSLPRSMNSDDLFALVKTAY